MKLIHLPLESTSEVENITAVTSQVDGGLFPVLKAFLGSWISLASFGSLFNTMPLKLQNTSVLDVIQNGIL